ncbi:hypothetical protein KIH87_00190 [Paraneptunicella aestuarii]|uniref:hypothetical protein n=1 Tax=Paraneptunicella aestuarii TaxID=2831148 RepID=UPI001E5405C7|nr:hypothetical protein [Paraneptunicella aestuarii]UAA38834.1 hypothetical protein KIH87_00190 [Paraneptunicella aestuarii]
MQQQFLCPVHRKWVYLHPKEAINHIQGAKEQGEQLRFQHRWEEALSHLGCALEITEILMDLEHHRYSKYSLLYTALSVIVADTQYRLKQYENAVNTLQNSKTWLKTLAAEIASQRALPASLQDCIHTLENGAQFFIEMMQRNYRHNPHQQHSMQLH